ncbi:MAG: Gfo/Idh/MocA family oxidoreductase [Anaerolineae bacterium]
METIRIGIVGSGIGADHARALALVPGAEVVAMAGTGSKRTRVVAAELGIPHVYDDWREMLDRERLDALTIGAPNSFHAPIAVTALQKGLHVLCEKPLADTLAGAEQIARAAHASDRVFMMAFNLRYRPDSQACKAAVARGQLGQCYYARAGWMRASGIPGIGSWFTLKALAGGGPVIDLGVHVLDLSLWMLGHPQPVSVAAATYAMLGPQGRGGMGGGRFVSGQGGYEVEDLAAAFIRFANGLTLSVEVSWASYGHIADGYYVQLYGDAGGVELDGTDRTRSDTVRLYGEGQGQRVEVHPAQAQDERQGGHNGVAQEFIAAIREGRASSAPVEDGLATQRIIDAIYRSAMAKSEVKVE